MKKWSKPELIVLVRTRPEEAVLQACKLATGTSGAAGFVAGCYTAKGPTHICQSTECRTQVGS
jgi:hypothetical protein